MAHDLAVPDGQRRAVPVPARGDGGRVAVRGRRRGQARPGEVLRRLQRVREAAVDDAHLQIGGGGGGAEEHPLI